MDMDSPILRSALQPLNDGPCLIQCRGPAALDPWVALPGIVVDMAGLDAVEEALVELENVAQMSPHAVRLQVGPVVHLVEEQDSLTQPVDVLVDEETLVVEEGGSLYRGSHRSVKSAGVPRLFP
jgi:hypothetical protein